MEQLFLDSNAHVNLNKAGLNAYVKYSSGFSAHGHPSSPNVPGRAAASSLEEAREKIAELIGAQSASQIIFTSTCTQACEWALEIVKAQNFSNYYCSKLEHPAIKLKYQELGNQNDPHNGFDLHYLNHSSDGKVHVSTFDYEKNSAVICVHMQNEIGTVQDIEGCNAEFLISDMSQSLGKMPVNVSSIPNLQIGIFGAHKFGGPMAGFMYLKDLEFYKEFGTGSRYFLDRPGTPDVASIVSTAAALEDVTKSLSRRYENMIKFRDVLEKGLEDLGWEIIGKDTKRNPSTTFAKVPKSLSFQIMNSLANEGVHIGLGSACGSANTGPSPLMMALGLNGTSRDYVRISQFGEYGVEEARYVLSKVKKFSNKKDKLDDI